MLSARCSTDRFIETAARMPSVRRSSALSKLTACRGDLQAEDNGCAQVGRVRIRAKKQIMTSMPLHCRCAMTASLMRAEALRNCRSYLCLVFLHRDVFRISMIFLTTGSVVHLDFACVHLTSARIWLEFRRSNLEAPDPVPNVTNLNRHNSL